MMFSVRFFFPISIARDDSFKNPQQYVLVYPNQPSYYVVRQDGGSTDFWSTIQNWFIGGSGTGEGAQSPAADTPSPDSSSESLDSVSVSLKSGFEKRPITAIPNFVIPIDDSKKDEAKKEKFFYLTPASTQILNPEKRLFVVPEQAKVLGAISGPVLNPVYNLQPIPSIYSRSSAPVVRQVESVVNDNRQPAFVQPQVAVVQPAAQPLVKLLPENVQVLSPVPPIEPLAKSILSDRLVAVQTPVDAPQNRIVSVDVPETRAGADVDEDGQVASSIGKDPTVAAKLVPVEPIEPISVVAASTVVQPEKNVVADGQSRSNVNAVLTAVNGVEVVPEVKTSLLAEKVTGDVVTKETIAPVAAN